MAIPLSKVQEVLSTVNDLKNAVDRRNSIATALPQKIRVSIEETPLFSGYEAVPVAEDILSTLGTAAQARVNALKAKLADLGVDVTK